MTCPSCGHLNRPSARHCDQCGARLTADDGPNPLPLSGTGRRRYTSREGSSPRADSPYRDEPVSERRAPQGRSRDINLTRSERELFGGGRRRTSAERSSSVFRILLIVVVVILLGVGAAWAASNLIPEQQEEGSVPQAELYTPDIEPGEDSAGNPVHILTFYGEKGDILYIPELQKNYTIESTNVRITIPDSAFIDENPEAATATVELHPVLYPLGKKARELETVTYTVQIPPSPITVLMPESDNRDETYQSIYLIKIQVEPGSAVSIDGSDVTDLIDADNVISHNVDIEPVGDNVIEITVATPGYRAHTERVTIVRPYMDIPIEIDVNAPLSSTSSAVNITGKTSPGATLSVSPSAEDVDVAADGEFTIKVKMTKYGENTYTLTASMAGKEDSSITHTIIYSPNLDEYSRNAWQMDYDHVWQNRSAFQGRIFECRGKVVETLSDNPYIFTFNVGTEDDPDLIVVEMIKDKPFELDADKTYSIWCDLEGEYEGMMRFNGRFFFEK